MKAISPGLIDYLRSETKIPFMFKRRLILRRYLFLFDAFAVLAAFILAYCLRYSFVLNDIALGLIVKQSALVLLVYLAFEAIFKSFAGIPKPTIFQNVVGILMSATMSLAVLWLINFIAPELSWLRNWAHIPASILFIHFLLSGAFLILIRLCCKTKV